MISLSKLIETTPKVSQIEVYNLLKEFYDSFFSDVYNEMNIKKYRPIRDATGLVIRKFDHNDHPLDYAGKLVLFIQARSVLDNLHLSDEQSEILKQLSNLTKELNLNYIYTGNITDLEQFLPS